MCNHPGCKPSITEVHTSSYCSFPNTYRQTDRWIERVKPKQPPKYFAKDKTSKKIIIKVL